MRKVGAEFLAILSIALQRRRMYDEEAAITESLMGSPKGKEEAEEEDERVGENTYNALGSQHGMAQNSITANWKDPSHVIVDFDTEVADPQTSSNQRVGSDEIDFSTESSRASEFLKEEAALLLTSRQAKPRLSALPNLALPLSPCLDISETSGTFSKQEDENEDKDGSGDGGPGSSGHSSPKSPSTLEDLLPWSTKRPKARLQEPPAISPAVKEQISRSISRRKNSITALATEGPGPPCLTHRNKSLTNYLSNTSSSSPGANKATLFSLPRGMKPSGNGLVAEEEQDPLDEDFIPEYKKFKKRENKYCIWAEWFGVFLLAMLLICSVTIKKVKGITWLGLNLWRWQVLVFVVFSGRLISDWVVKLFVALIENHCLLKKRVLYFVYGLRRAVKNCIWLALVLGVWEVIFEGREKTTAISIVTRVLWCCFTISIAWMLKVLAVKAAASGFHRAAYFDRIQDCLFNQFLLETLSAPPTMAKVCDSAESQSADFEETVTLSGINRSHSNSSKATPNTAARCAISTDDEIQKATREQPRSMQGDFASHKQHSRGKVNQILHGAIQGRHRQAQAGVLAKRACLTDGKHELNADPKRLQGSENSPNKAHNLQSSNQAGGRWPSGGFDKPTLGVDEHTLKPASHTSGNSENRIAPRQASETMAANESFEAAQQQQTPTQRRMSASIGPLIALSSNPIEQDKLQQLTSETVSAWTLKRLIKVIRHTNIATYTSMFAHEKGDWEIDSEVRAKAAAKQIFYNMARPGQKYLMLKDFIYFLSEDKATRAFALFETTENGRITKKALMKWVVSVYKERRALALTLNDNKTVVAKLHRVLDVVLAVVLFIASLLILGVDTSKLLVFFSSIFIPSVFIFGNAAKTTFEALIFLFIIHPFDVGDRISVDGQTMLVEEMNVLNTTFLSGSNEKIYYPNSVLANKAISNFYRSPDQCDGIEFQVHVSTSIEKLGALKERMQSYIESLPQFWYPDFGIICKDIEDHNKMKMGLWMQHHLNFQEAGERYQRRSNLLLYMKQQLEDLGIGYQLPKQEIIVRGLPLHIMSSSKQWLL